MLRRPLRAASCGAALLLTLALPVSAPGSEAIPEGPSAPVAESLYDRLPGAEERRPQVRHVVAISIDGLRSDALTRLGASGAPNLHRLLREGAGTLDARNLAEVTITLPNHTAMITGRPATAPGGHGIDVNDDRGGTVHDRAGEYVESVFDVVHDAGGSTALLVTKSKFDLFDRSWNAANGAPDRVGADDGTDKIDRYLRSSPGKVVDDLTAAVRAGDLATFTFLHLKNPDSAGHRSGWMTRSYLGAVRRADALVGRVLDVIAASPDRSSDTVVILTADHGGWKDDHSDIRRLANARVPFAAWGAGVAQGADLYELNAGSRTRPGSGIPGYGDPPPVRNAELANLALDLLGLPPVTGSVFDARQDLVVSAD